LGNFASGIYGGISLAQYARIGNLAGVRVAAPIAMVGTVMLTANILVPLGRTTPGAAQVWRIAAA
jgi:putative ABC transport system permease protein